MTSAIVIVTIAAALIFDVINGFHDAANSIATVVSTRVLSPKIAVLWAAFFNFVALFIFHEGVADTISKIITVEKSQAYVLVVVCGLSGAILWNLFTWFLGLQYRQHHEAFGWAYQQHVRTIKRPPPRPMGRPLPPRGPGAPGPHA